MFYHHWYAPVAPVPMYKQEPLQKTELSYGKITGHYRLCLGIKGNQIQKLGVKYNFFNLHVWELSDQKSQ